VYIEYEISEFVNDTGRPTSLSLIAFVVIGSIFVIVFTVTWRTTTRPVRMIREETELAMKGDLPQVSFESHWPEMDQLVHSINRVLRRATPGGSKDSAKLESLVELAAWPVILTDGQLHVTHANAVSAHVLSSDERSAVGKPLPNLVKDAAVASKMKTLFASLGGSNGKQGSDTVVIDGRNRKLSILVETSSSGAPEYAVVVIT
jgi:signal transduction histidine kinase